MLVLSGSPCDQCGGFTLDGQFQIWICIPLWIFLYFQWIYILFPILDYSGCRTYRIHLNLDLYNVIQEPVLPGFSAILDSVLNLDSVTHWIHSHLDSETPWMQITLDLSTSSSRGSSQCIAIIFRLVCVKRRQTLEPTARSGAPILLKGNFGTHCWTG